MMNDVPEPLLAPFGKDDTTDDLLFYAPTRLVTHIDDAALSSLTAFYRSALPRGGAILDLMSSWVGHLPPDLPTRETIGHGMNALELAANPRLDRWFIQDLNTSPALPLSDASVDTSLCCVSVQYLQRPVEVFAEVHRVLRTGAPFGVSFSNRCFPKKSGPDLARARSEWPSGTRSGLFRTCRLYIDRGRSSQGRIGKRSADRGYRSRLGGNPDGRHLC